VEDELMADLWNAHEFRLGLWFGVAAAIALLLVGLAASTRRKRRPLLLGGVVIAAGGLWSIADSHQVPAAVVLGVIGVGAAGGLTHVRWISRRWSFALAVPLAALIGFWGELVTDRWVQLLVTFAASVGALLTAEFDHSWRAAAPGLTLLGVSALGVYAAVPDTEVVAAVVGVSLPLLVLGWPVRLATLGRGGAAAAVALLVWAGAVGGEGRPASIIAVVTCLGLLVGSPVGQLLLPRVGDRFRRGSRGALTLSLVGSHVVIVLVASRVGGQLSSPLAAAVVGTFVVLAAVLVGALFRPPLPAVSWTRVD
jgi:uncharacterized membrane protein YeaQ/YmgE (transglycosylase-associated protein family)